jgi:hypothetical protein
LTLAIAQVDIDTPLLEPAPRKAPWPRRYDFFKSVKLNNFDFLAFARNDLTTVALNALRFTAKFNPSIN